MMSIYCDLCEHLTPHEENQTKNKEPHICQLLGRQLFHGEHHPSILTPDDCPMERARELDYITTEE